MSDTLTVRVYNVRFGDAILLTVPDRDPVSGEATPRRILIDVGNVPTSLDREGGDDSVFQPVIEDILEQLDGSPLDLYVMTHEHLDHVAGLPYVAWKAHVRDFADRFAANHVWLTGSAAPDYYETHPDAEKLRLGFEAMYRQVCSWLTLNAAAAAPNLLRMLHNNDPSKTGPCVDYLRSLNPDHTAYVHRGVDLSGRHPFKEASFEIWAPEEDTSTYYGRFQPLALGEADAPAAAETESRASAPLIQAPPQGVDLGAFLNLVRARENGVADNLLAIDKAANNTSIVFVLAWRGWRLLFAGDAEIRSWRTMEKNGVLSPVHFLKVAHHGSHNGTPDDDILEAILPAAAHDARRRSAAISLWRDTYSGIPDEPTAARLSSRCELHSTLDPENEQELYYELTFEG